MSQYTAVFRCPTALRFEQGDYLGPLPYKTPFGTLRVVFGSSYKNYKHRGLDQSFPYELSAEVHGSATSVQQVIDYFGGTVQSAVPFLAVSTNAATGNPDIALVYDSTPGVTQRAFFQKRVPWDDSLPRDTRQVPKEATRSLLFAVNQHAETDRLRRAIEHYSLALEHWQPGREISILSHLWMCAETLTHVATMRRCQDNGLPASNEGQKELALKLNLKKDCNEPDLTMLNARIRLEDLFRQNKNVYKTARDGRNALVHGFKSFQIIRNEVRGVCEPMAAYLRSAIFRLSNLDVDMQQRLSEAQYSAPLGNWPVQQHMLGTLEGTGDTLAPQNWPHPHLTWDIALRPASETNPHDYPYGCEFQVTTHLAEGIVLNVEEAKAYSPNKLQSE